AQIETFDRIIAEMLVEPRPPGRAQQIAGLQHAAQPRAGAAAHQTEVPAALQRHQLENDAGLAVPFDAEHDAVVGPLHGRYVARLPEGFQSHRGATASPAADTSRCTDSRLTSRRFDAPPRRARAMDRELRKGEANAQNR